MSFCLKLKCNEIENNEIFLLAPKEKNVFYSYLKLYRLAFLMIGHWPYQNKLHCFVLNTIQLTLIYFLMKGQVNIHVLLNFVLVIIPPLGCPLFTKVP